IMMLPAMFFRCIAIEEGTLWRNMFDLGVFALATMSAGVFYMASQVELFKDWRTVFKYMPVLMAIGVGLSVSNSKAILEALFGKQSAFVRTPKYGDGTAVKKSSGVVKKNKSKIKLLPYVEFAFGVYMAACVVWSMRDINSVLATPFLLIFTFGFFYVSLMTFHAQRANAAVSDPAEEKEAVEAA
ncbi:MAG: hypothetical protein ACLFVU_10300, partial [Phycisphaerae bacterium]